MVSCQDHPGMKGEYPVLLHWDTVLLFSPMYTHILLCSYQSLHAEPPFREREGFGCPFTAHHSITWWGIIRTNNQ